MIYGTAYRTEGRAGHKEDVTMGIRSMLFIKSMAKVIGLLFLLFLMVGCSKAIIKSDCVGRGRGKGTLCCEFR